MSKNSMSKLVVQSWNPFTGCTKISPACKNCYAETLALKLNQWETAGYENKFKLTIHQDRLDKAAPLARKRPTLFFINNMSDTFHEDVDEESIDKILDIVRQAYWHNFLVLTKRSEKMKNYFNKNSVPDNLWLGVTVENKKHGFPRLKDLQSINSKNKYIVCEPLLEGLEDIDMAQIKLVFGGGESGYKARKTNLSWVESLQRQCELQNVHFYWKSWGTYDQNGVFKGKSQSNCLVNGKEYLSFPEDLMP